MVSYSNASQRPTCQILFLKSVRLCHNFCLIDKFAFFLFFTNDDQRNTVKNFFSRHEQAGNDFIKY